MIILSDIKDWLKTVFNADHYYVGKLDVKNDKSLGVYSLKQSLPPVVAIGEDSTYDIIGVSLLLHWNNNSTQTETAARTLYETLRTVRDVTINNAQIFMIQLLQSEPVDVDTDDKGVYERVIEMNLYYERMN